MEDPFYASIKLTTGEEILAEVCSTHEDGEHFFVVSNPIVINESMTIDHKKGVIMSGLTPKKWMMYANDDLTIIHKEHVISISEMDKFGAAFYSKALVAARISSPIRRSIRTVENTGFVGKIENARNKLERLFNMSNDISE